MSEVDDFLNSYDPAKPAAARSQVDELMASAPSQDKGFLGHAKDVGLSALKGTISVPEAGVGIADIFTGGRVGKALENEGGAIGFRPREAREFLDQFHTEGYQDQQQKFQQADGILGKAAVALRNPSLITNTVVESLPLMGAGGVVARGLMGRTRLGAKGVEGGVAASALGEGTVMAGSQAEGIRQETDSGLITPVQSAAAVGTGALGALFAFAGGRLAQKLGIGDVDTMLARGVTPRQVAADLASSSPKSIPRQVIEGAISEGFLEELPQEVSEQILQNLALGDPWHKDVEQAAVMGTLAGMAMGGAGAGYAGVVNKSPRTDTFRETPTDPGEAAPPAEPTPSGPAPGVGTPAPQVDPQYRTERFPSDSPRADTPLQIGMDPDAGTSPAPSLLLGLDPNAGPLSSAAAIAVDSGATQNLAEQEALAQAAETAQEQEKQSAQEKPDALRPEPAQPASDATVQGTRTPKQQKAIDRITNGKAFFFSQPKAQNFIDDNDLASTHELEQRGKSWHVVERKAEDAPAQESEARPESTVNAAAQQSEQIDAAAHEAATSPQNDLPEPTQAQKLAGNYSKGHVRVQGLDITIENPQGSERSGVDPDGNEWRHTMSHHYGYIKRTSGADGDQVDVYVGPNPTSDKVFVVDQIDQQSGRFDEHKVMAGFDSEEAAVDAYRSNFDDGWKVGPVRAMGMDEFKAWLDEGDTTKPAADAKPANLQEGIEQARENKATQADDKFAESHGFKRINAPGAEWVQSIEVTPNHVNRYNLRRTGGGTLGPAKFRLVSSATFPGTSVTGAPSAEIGVFDSAQEAIDAFNEHRALLNERRDGTAPVPTAAADIDAQRQALEKMPEPKWWADRSPTGRYFVQRASGIPNPSATRPWNRFTAEQQRDLDQQWGERSASAAQAPTETAAVGRLGRSDEWRAEMNRIADRLDEIGKGIQATSVRRMERGEGANADFDADALLASAQETLARLDTKRAQQPAKSEPEKAQEAAPKQEAAPEAETKAKDADRFAGNKLFTADKVAAARARMKSKLGRLNSGIDPEMLVDGMTIAGAYIESGVRNFTQYARAMIEDLGDGVKPYLLSFWEGARNYPGLDAKDMTDPAESARQHQVLLMPTEPGVSREAAAPASATDPAARRKVAEDKKARALSRRQQAYAEKNPFRAFLATHGVNVDDRSDVGGDRRRQMMVPNFGVVFRRNGARLDELARLALEEGFLTQADVDSDFDNGGVNKLSDLIRREIDGETIRPVDDESEWERMSRERDEAMEDAEAAMVELLTDDEINALADIAATEDAEISDGEIDEALGVVDTQEGGGQTEEGSARSEAGSDPSGRTEAGGGEPFELETTTPEVLRQQEQRQEKARQEEAERARRAEADAEEFVLTGSGRAVDQAIARGQQELMPATTQAATAVRTKAPAEKPTAGKSQAESGKAVEAKPGKAEVKPEGKIDDFGEKIEGARKDVWASFAQQMKDAEGEDIAAVPLSKSWPVPDYQALLDNGADPWAVGFLHAIRDEVPAKPRSRGINAWVAQVKMLRHLGMTGIREIMPPERTREMLEEERRGLGDVAGRAELYTLVGHSKSLAGVRVRRGEYSVFEGKHYRPPRIIWTVEKEAPKTAFSNWPRIFVRGDTREEAIANFKRDFEKIEITKPAAKEVTFGVYSKRGENGYWIGRKIGRNPVLLEGPFEKIADAREYLQSHNDDLLAKLDRAKAIPSERRDTNEPRVGEDMRNGADVTPEMFAEAFGFRGVQFGNYVEQGRRQKDLNDAFDALMDMAAIIGVPPRALSLNGELGLAFGARGTGGKNAAAAHYEPGHVVINLTKREGAGSLGHEWWHALDNYFSRMRKAPADYLTEADDVQTASRAGGKFVHRGEVRAEMIKAFGGVMRAINLTAIKSRSSKLDERRSKAYWTTKREMGARAFESYLISKLQDQGASNDYLANIVDEKTWAAAAQIGFEIDGSYPYPTAGEVPAIRAAFDHFFQTAQSRETDVGVMLFSRGPTTKAAYEARIDALFAGEKAATGTRVLDRSDVMRLLGYPDAPLLLNESHLLDGMASHPEMTPAQWKRVPGWIESPAVAYEDRGRIVMIAPDTVAGYPVRIVIEPEARRAGRLDETDQLLVTVFAKTTAPHLPNFGRLAADGAIRYLDTKKAPEVWQSGGAQFPKHATALQRRRKILTEKNLAGWRRANTLTYSFAGIRAEGADQMGLTTAQAQVDQGVDPEAVRRLTGWHRGADGKWRFEISDHQASLKVAGATFGELFADAHVNAYVAGRETPTVGDILEHDRLFAAYPALAEIPVAEMPAGQRALARLQRRAGGLRILVQPGMRRDAVVSAMLHELQHGIQLTEGFASGGSRHVLSAAMGEAGAKAYRRLAGEVEARNTQARQDMPPRSREVVPPEETADVAAADVIVTINGKRVEAPPQNAAPAAMTQGALRRAMSRQFPSLNRAFGRMLERGQSGERGGLVLVHDADPRAIARVFAQKTGRALSDAVQTFSNAGTINGFYDPRSGLTFMIMPNVDEVTAPAVILHEMVHGQQRKRLDKQAHDMIQNRARQKDGDLRAFLDRVAARMEDAGETSNQLEAAPYIVEQAVMEGRSQGQTLADSKFLTWVDKTIGKPVGDFLRSFLRGIRAWMLRNGMPIGQITVDDLVQYAMVGMERAAQGDVAGASGFSSGEQITRRGSEQDAIAAGFTMKAYRGISESAPFNDSGSTWSTTNREVALEYAEEVMGYDDPAVIEVMIRPDGLKRYDASRLTDEQRAALDADGLGNPQAIGIYDRSDDHTLGGGAGNVTVIHAPNSAIWLVDDGSLRFSRSGIQRVTAAATAELNRTFNVPGKLSWWHKTVGTMYNLAERSPHFKPVFESAQNFIDDVAYFATDAAELAPNLLPRLETWRDIAKRPITSKDNGAIAKPIFEGTLLWTRDENGAPVRLADGDEITSAGIVWTDAELRSMFGLNDKQVGLYREFREATNRSLDTMARADMIRYGGDDLKLIKARVMDASDVHEAARVIVEHLRELASVEPDRATSLMQVAHGIIERAARVKELQDQGYAPLSRFGQYTVDVVVDGARQYFGMFESKREANKMREAMAAEFGAANVTQGTLSNETYKLFAGVTPETLELFGTMLGLEGSGDQARDHAFQEYLRLTKTNRSAMRRLIHRKGVAGYSEDVGRVLASFVYSNSRQTAAGLNIGELGEAINAIPKEQGELKDAAVRLGEYIKNPQEEGQVIRGFLFAQYLGGSVASAFVNLTQPAQVTFPWLTQFTTATDSAAQIAKAVKHMSTRGFRYEADLAAALKAAEDDGTVSPQEIHQLMGQARGSGSLRAGDGTRAGDARVAASNATARLSLAWGKMFSAAEQANRRITFIAAYRIARDKGMTDPAGFARRAVRETQFVYSKASKMQWGRGAVGGTLMTFKTYSISYIELMHRLWTQGEPGSQERAEGRKAAMIMIATLMLLSGVGGLPFIEDVDDVIDGAAQLMGYNFSIKKVKEGFLEDVFGDVLAEFIDRGFSGFPGFPMDVSGRLGLGNLIPGTGLLQERTSHTRDVLEILGPGGDFANRVISGGRKVLGGNVGGGLLEMSPVAVRNLAKGADMAVHGMYRDTKGYKVLDTNLLEAAVKAAGIQPASVSKIQEANWISQRAKNYYNTRAQEIRQMWAAGIFENDMGKVQRARDAVARWDAKNPDQPMLIRIPDVMRRVREMAKTKDERIAATAPRAMRQQMREDLSRARANL